MPGGWERQSYSQTERDLTSNRLYRPDRLATYLDWEIDGQILANSHHYQLEKVTTLSDLASFVKLSWIFGFPSEGVKVPTRGLKMAGGCDGPGEASEGRQGSWEVILFRSLAGHPPVQMEGKAPMKIWGLTRRSHSTLRQGEEKIPVRIVATGNLKPSQVSPLLTLRSFQTQRVNKDVRRVPRHQVCPLPGGQARH